MSAERDPSRLIEPGSTAPAPLRRALGAARGVAPSHADIAALAARLPLPPGPPPGSGDTGGGGESNTGSAQSAGGAEATAAKGAGGALAHVSKIAAPSAIPGALVGAALGLVVGGGWLALTSGAPPEVAVSPPSLAPPAVTTATPSGADTGAPPAPSVTSRAAAAPASGTGTAGPLPTESELLERARAGARSDPAATLALVAEHASRFPSGPLTQEREVIAITALVAAGRTAEAHARAERFFAAFPGSPHLRRVDALFAGSKNEEADKNSPALSPPTP